MAMPNGRGPAPPSTWLSGPALDVLLGCGGAYLLSVPILMILGRASGVRGWSPAAATLLALIVSGPHYGATLLRVYREPEERRKYRFFAIYLTLLLLVVFVVAIRDVTVGSWLLTLYVNWSIWHFSGQNYGVLLMLLRRRGVAIPAAAKRWLLASFVLSFALSLLIIHAQASPYVLAIGAEDGGGYHILRLGIPVTLVTPLAVGAGALYVSSLIAATRLLRRGARWRDLTPALLILLTQATWFAIPGLLVANGGLTLDALPFTAVWISLAHAVQYLWVTSFCARRSAHPHKPLGHVASALAAGAALMTLPPLIFAPDLFGSAPWDAGLAVMTFSVINLHHFILDGAVWKLRDGRVARALLCIEPANAPRSGPAGRGLEAPLWMLGSACLVAALVAIWQQDVSASADPGAARAALDRLRWIGHDSSQQRLAVGLRLASGGETDQAIAQFRRSIALHATADAWAALAVAEHNAGDWEGARAADASALKLAPDHAVALLLGADLALRRAGRAANEDAASSERAYADSLLDRLLSSGADDSVTRATGLALDLDRDRSADATRIRAAVARHSAAGAIAANRGE